MLNILEALHSLPSFWWERTAPFLTKIRWDLAKTLILIGIILRFKNFVENRSFWVDESWSALEVANRSFADIISHDYIFPISSRPPTLYLLIQKFFTLLLGNNELAFRYFPLLCSIVSLMIFYFLSKKCLSRYAFNIAIGLFALSEPLIHYASEAKRYSSTVLSALAIWFLGVEIFTKKFSRNRAIFLGILSVSVPWLSTKSLFVLFSLFTLLALKFVLKKDWNAFFALSIAGCAAFINALFIYQVSLKNVIQAPTLTSTWNNALNPAGISLAGTILWSLKIFRDSLINPAGLGMPLAVAILLIVGIIIFSRKDRWIAALFYTPILLTMLLAVLRIYPFQGRVIIFLVPAYYLFIANGADFVTTRFHKLKPLFLMIILLLLFYKPATSAVYFVIHERPRTHNRALHQFFRDHYQPGDHIFMTNQVRYSFWYYAGSLGFGKNLTGEKFVDTNGDLLKTIKVGIFAGDPTHYKGEIYAAFIYEYHVFDESGFFKKSLIPKGTRISLFSADTATPYPNSGRAWIFLNTAGATGDRDVSDIILSSFKNNGKKILEVTYPNKSLNLYLLK